MQQHYSSLRGEESWTCSKLSFDIQKCVKVKRPKAEYWFFNGSYHRVGRVLSFFSSRRNWDSRNPSPAGECAPPPPFGSGGRAQSLARERGWESPNSDEGTYNVVLYIYVLVEKMAPTMQREWWEAQLLALSFPLKGLSHEMDLAFDYMYS